MLDIYTASVLLLLFIDLRTPELSSGNKYSLYVSSFLTGVNAGNAALICALRMAPIRQDLCSSWPVDDGQLPHLRS